MKRILRTKSVWIGLTFVSSLIGIGYPIAASEYGQDLWYSLKGDADFQEMESTYADLSRQSEEIVRIIEIRNGWIEEFIHKRMTYKETVHNFYGANLQTLASLEMIRQNFPGSNDIECTAHQVLSFVYSYLRDHKQFTKENEVYYQKELERFLKEDQATNTH